MGGWGAVQGTLKLSPQDKEQIWQRVGADCFRGRNSKFRDGTECSRSEEPGGQ